MSYILYRREICDIVGIGSILHWKSWSAEGEEDRRCNRAKTTTKLCDWTNEGEVWNEYIAFVMCIIEFTFLWARGRMLIFLFNSKTDSLQARNRSDPTLMMMHLITRGLLSRNNDLFAYFWHSEVMRWQRPWELKASL